MKVKVALIYGGKSLEHEVSVIGALNAYLAFDEDKYEVMLVYLDKNNDFYVSKELDNLENYTNIETLLHKSKKVYLTKKNNQPCFKQEGLFPKNHYFDVAFLFVHGKGVEDGTLTGIFELLDIPYVGTNVLSSAISQDKVISKKILETENLSIVPYCWFYKEEFYENKDSIISMIENKLSYPLIIKAATLGSSIGVYKVDNNSELINALYTVCNYDDKILVEKAIVNFKEINCGLFKEEQKIVVGDLEEVFKSEAILSYKDKYEPNEDKRIKRLIPAQISRDLYQRVIDLAKKSYRLLNNHSIARIDFIYDEKNDVLYFNEINTIPGSLANYLFVQKGIIYPLLLDRLINQALKDYLDKKTLINSYDINLFSSYIKLGNKLK